MDEIQKIQGSIQEAARPDSVRSNRSNSSRKNNKGFSEGVQPMKKGLEIEIPKDENQPEEHVEAVAEKPL